MSESMSEIDLEKNFKYFVLSKWLPKDVYLYLVLITTHLEAFTIPEFENLLVKISVCWDSITVNVLSGTRFSIGIQWFPK